MILEVRKYKINEIFYSLQGEGASVGAASIFVRFSGCNRACPFCDTVFKPFKERSADEICQKIKGLTNLIPHGWKIVLTGGEPSLQIDEELITALKQNFDAEIHVETNGSTFETFNPKRFPALFFTVSPKTEKDARSFVQTCLENDFRTGIEIKIVSVPLVGNAEDDFHDAIEDTLEIFDELPDSIPRFIQPCDFGNEEQNEIERTKCIILVKCHPKWRLSLQIHKILNIR